MLQSRITTGTEPTQPITNSDATMKLSLCQLSRHTINTHCDRPTGHRVSTLALDSCMWSRSHRFAHWQPLSRRLGGLWSHLDVCWQKQRTKRNLFAFKQNYTFKMHSSCTSIDISLKCSQYINQSLCVTVLPITYLHKSNATKTLIFPM